MNYGFGSLGYNIMYIWVSSFLTIYYTDIIGVKAAAVSALLLIVRVYDAINDPIIGSWADRTSGRFGKYKSWILPGSFVLGLSIYLLFSARPNWSDAFKLVWMYLLYIVVTTASTCTDVPHASLVGRQTTDGLERSKLASMRGLFFSLGANIPTMLAAPLLVLFSAAGERDAQGYSRTLLLFCVIGVALLLATVRRINVRVSDPPKQNKLPLRQQIQTVTRNRPLRIATYAFFVMGCLSYGRYAIMLYYFTYVCGNAGLMTYTGVAGLATGVFGALCVPSLMKRVKNKGKAASLLLFVSAVCYAASYFFNANMTIWWILTAVTMMLSTAYNAAQYSILPDAIDYGEYVTGIRCDGFNTAIVSLALKVGGAVLPTVLLALLHNIGYVPNAEQTELVKTILNFFMTMLPAILIFLMGCLYFFGYKITPQKYAEIQAELARRRRQENNEY